MPVPPLAAEWRRWHGLIERYTPDGLAARLAFGLLGLFAVGPFLFFAGLTQAFGDYSGILVSELVGVAAAVAGPPLMVAAAVALWPVFLLLTDRVDSVREYDPGRQVRQGVRGEPDAGGDSIDRLKRRYAAGELTEAEFERRLEAALDAEGTRMVDEGAVSRVESAANRGETEALGDPEVE